MKKYHPSASVIALALKTGHVSRQDHGHASKIVPQDHGRTADGKSIGSIEK